MAELFQTSSWNIMKEIILKDDRFILNAVFFTVILFAIFLLKSCKERERQQELATKWERLNEERFQISRTFL